jgi:four helix bundle protein
MTKETLKDRTKKFALRVMAMTDHLPKSAKGNTIARQILRSATSVAANCRAACRGRSKPEFAAKLGIALEECDETQFWRELIVEGGLLPAKKLSSLIKEADELSAILFSAQRTTRQSSINPNS